MIYALSHPFLPGELRGRFDVLSADLEKAQRSLDSAQNTLDNNPDIGSLTVRKLEQMEEARKQRVLALQSIHKIHQKQLDLYKDAEAACIAERDRLEQEFIPAKCKALREALLQLGFEENHADLCCLGHPDVAAAKMTAADTLECQHTSISAYRQLTEKHMAELSAKLNDALKRM